MAPRRDDFKIVGDFDFHGRSVPETIARTKPRTYVFNGSTCASRVDRLGRTGEKPDTIQNHILFVNHATQRPLKARREQTRTTHRKVGQIAPTN